LHFSLKNLGHFLGSTAHCLLSSRIPRQCPNKEPPMQLFSWLHQRMSRRPHAGCTPARKPTRRFRPQLEALEGRDVPSTLKVTNTFDSGPGSLRYEIAQAKSNDTIAFDFGTKKSQSSSHTITLTTGELVISKNLTIKGPGAYRLTITSQQWVNGA